jgi:hypothetical protein
VNAEYFPALPSGYEKAFLRLKRVGNCVGYKMVVEAVLEGMQSLVLDEDTMEWKHDSN